MVGVCQCIYVYIHVGITHSHYMNSKVVICRNSKSLLWKSTTYLVSKKAKDKRQHMKLLFGGIIIFVALCLYARILCILSYMPSKVLSAHLFDWLCVCFPVYR